MDSNDLKFDNGRTNNYKNILYDLAANSILDQLAALSPTVDRVLHRFYSDKAKQKKIKSMICIMRWLCSFYFLVTGIQIGLAPECAGKGGVWHARMNNSN